MQKKTNLRNQNGVVAVYVTISIIVFIIILTAIYIAAVSVRKNQIKTLVKLKEVYEQDNSNIEKIYNSKELQALINQSASDSNIYTQDKYGNKIVIPAGFIVLGNKDNYVVYDYDQENEQSTGIPVVQDGIVIQDGEGNEFVWVPVGTIINNVEGTNTTNLKLGRYNDYTMTTTTTPPTPPEPSQEASKTEYNTVILINDQGYNYFENSTGEYNGITYEGAKFETLGNWISNTIDNGGYYIARYEASYGIDGKANSKQSEGIPLNSSNTSSSTKTEGQLWNYVTQGDASTASKAMYTVSENLGYYSELTNSYAWDTAIIFIQTYENVDYANQTSVYNDTISTYQPANTGERGTDVEIGSDTTDKVCNIYDIASNTREWITETNENNETPCVFTGGGFFNTSLCAKHRYYGSTSDSNYSRTFRPLLNCNPES